MPTKCAVCGKEVAYKDQDDHLKSAHLGPHYFWFNAKKLRTMSPSMTMAEVKAFGGIDPSYQAFEEREGGDVYYGDSEAVDLTRGSHFWAAPPATMWG